MLQQHHSLPCHTLQQASHAPAQLGRHGPVRYAPVGAGFCGGVRPLFADCVWHAGGQPYSLVQCHAQPSTHVRLLCHAATL